MREIPSTFVYKCPGMSIQKDIRYTYKGVSTQEELDSALEAGWFTSLDKAAEDAGEKAIFVKRKPKKKGVNKYAKGLPSVPVKTHVEEFKEVFKIEDIENIEAVAEVFEDTLLDQFKLNPELLTKSQHKELGNAYGLKLTMAMKESTMIKYIQETLKENE